MRPRRCHPIWRSYLFPIEDGWQVDNKKEKDKEKMTQNTKLNNNSYYQVGKGGEGGGGGGSEFVGIITTR